MPLLIMDPLSILNLKPGSTVSDAKKSYRRLSLKFHPDKNPDDPQAEESFRSIQEAYDYIKNNPGVLSIKNEVPKNRAYSGYIITEASADISDVYLGKTKSVRISRKRICKTCKGSGSSLGTNGVCDLCKGDKKVKNRVSSLIGIKEECPACKGTGKKEAPPCKGCNGLGYFNEEVLLTFTVNTSSFNNSLVVLNNVGNEYKLGYLGDVHIKLKVTYNNRMVLEGDTFRFSYGITPAQYVLGDIIRINVLGKVLDMVIPKESYETFIMDQRGDGNTRKIHVDLVLVNKPLTPEIKSLYEEILRLEQSIK